MLYPTELRGLEKWWTVQGSNLRPVVRKTTALPTELTVRKPPFKNGFSGPFLIVGGRGYFRRSRLHPVWWST